MTDLDHALLAAWNRLWPILRRDPLELARRVARRRSGILLRPPRAWCIAIRASDRRLNEATAAIIPQWAVYRHPQPLRSRSLRGARGDALRVDAAAPVRPRQHRAAG